MRIRHQEFYSSRQRLTSYSAEAATLDFVSLLPPRARCCATVVALSSFNTPAQVNTRNLSEQQSTRPDEFYEHYHRNTYPSPQRQQQAPLLASQRPPSSLGSDSHRSIRRTPRLQERHSARQPYISKSHSPPQPADRRAIPERPPPTTGRLPSDIEFGNSGSTTPQSFQRLVELESYWPQRSTRVSRKTHDAILFALEAIRTGKGVDAKPLTTDLEEEEARMSDLQVGASPAGAPYSTSAGYATTQAPAGAGGRSIITPTQIMERRRDREAKKAAAERLQGQQPDSSRPSVVEGPVVGVGVPPGQGTEPAFSPIVVRTSSSRRNRENQPTTTNGARPRVPNPGTRPVSSPPPAVGDPNYTDQRDRNRSEALRQLNTVGAKQPPQSQSRPQSRPAPDQPPQPQPQPAQSSARPTFPHAFERWETLSSHWEGLTGYWIRRLQANKDELSGKPIDQQMARQVADLSAAGANLFHAVVELQRLRASSERKFQRWFFETRNEQEQAQERVAELERQLQQERQSGNNSTTSFEAIKAEKSKADELVKEMRRELQISKEEARRAWEELGRREQEERDRTIALRSGEPTTIGGVQVVPMAGGLASRYVSAVQRPQTRDGPVPGGAGPTLMSGQVPQDAFSRSQTTLESPDQEQAQFSYRPGGASPTSTDPFTEPARINEPMGLRHEPDTQFYTQQPRSQPSSSAAAMAARSVASPSHSATGSQSRFYEQPGISTAIHQPLTSHAPTQVPIRSVTAHTDRSDPRSYHPSISGGESEDEFHINPDGSFPRDAQGRRIPYSQPLGRPAEVSEEDEEDDYAAEIEREQYNQRQQTAPRGTGVNVPTSTTAAVRTQYAGVPQQGQTVSQAQLSPVSPQSHTSTASATSQPRPGPDYEGGEYGTYQQQAPPTWENRRHQHPTRLSDILEEQSARTSPSRTSYMSGDLPPVTSSGHAPPRR